MWVVLYLNKCKKQKTQYFFDTVKIPNNKCRSSTSIFELKIKIKNKAESFDLCKSRFVVLVNLCPNVFLIGQMH